MSETGAFLITNHTLAQGLAVRLVLSEGHNRILDTKASIVWSAEGFDPSSEIVGALQGVLFAGLSPLDREQLRRLLVREMDQRVLFTEIMKPGFMKNYPPGEEELAYELIDPDIEHLISDETIDYNDGIAQIRQELEPYMEQYVAKIYEERSWGDETTRATLEYLEHQVSRYPFDRRLDCEFVVELMADFPGVDVLEEVKTFRWHYEGEPVSQFTNPRSALRRWLAGSVNDHGNGHDSGNGN